MTSSNIDPSRIEASRATPSSQIPKHSRFSKLGDIANYFKDSHVIKVATSLGKVIIESSIQKNSKIIKKGPMRKAVSHLAKKTTETIGTTISITQKISQSKLGRYLVNSVKENAAEYLGWYMGKELTSAVVKNAGELAMRNIGLFVGYSMAALSATFTVVELHESTLNAASSAKISALMALTGLTAYALPTAMAEMGQQLGGLVGAWIGDVTGGIFGGYAGMIMADTNEVFYSDKAPMNNYVAKSLQCILFYILQEQIRGPREGPIDFLFDQMKGVLVYHALAITNLIIAFRKGHVLDEFLPLDLKTTVLISPIIESIKEIEFSIPKELVDVSINLFIKGFNEFREFTRKDSLIAKKQSEFDVQYENWRKENNPQNKDMQYQTFQNSKKELLEAIKTRLSPYIIESIKNARPEMAAAIPINEITKTMFDYSVQISKEDHIKDKTNLLANKIALDLKKFEARWLGFTISSDDKENYLKEILSVQMSFIADLSFLNAIILSSPVLEESDIQKFYYNLFSMASTLYPNHLVKPLLGKLAEQAKTSKLRLQ